MRKELSFIIPCAGKGSRLGSPFPKELFPIDKNVTLIDKIFDCIRPFKDKSQVIIIISEEKYDLIKYLKKYSNDFDIIFVYQKDDLKELCGAIKSASELFSEKNILLLPDIVLIDDDLNGKFKEFIENDGIISFLIKEEQDENILKRMGAMYVENKKLISTIDKPTLEQIKENNFNSYWVAFMFKLKYATDFLNNFEKMQKHEEYDKKYFVNMQTTTVSYALDLGVWENIRKFYYDLARTIYRNS